MKTRKKLMTKGEEWRGRAGNGGEREVLGSKEEGG